MRWARGWAWWSLMLLGSQVGVACAAVADARRFTSADGLPSSIVHQVLEDRQGYLWFATDDGLARFDGQRFRIWRIEQGLADNQLLSMARDSDDQLWVGTSQGQLIRVSADRQQFETFDRDRFPALAGAPILSVLAAPGGVIWFGTRGEGLFRLGAQHRLRQYLPPRRGDGLPDRTVEHLAMAGEGTLWVGTPRGLARWREDRFAPPLPSLLAEAPVTALVADAQGTVWVGSAAGPWRSLEGPRLEPLDLAAAARPLGASRRGAPWLAEGTRVWRGDAGLSSAVLALPPGSGVPQLRAAFEDRHGGLWLLGHQLGVWRLPPHWQYFRAAGPASAEAASLAGLRLDGAQRHTLRCAADSVWQLDAAGLSRRTGSAGSWQHWPWAALQVSPADAPVALQCDGGHGLWWGGRGGLRRWSDGALHAVAGVDADVDALHVAADGALWVARPGALLRYHVGEEGLQQRARFDARHGLPGVRLSSLASDTHGVIWASSPRGLLRVRPRDGQMRLYTRGDGLPETVFSARLEAEGASIRAHGRDGHSVRFDPAGLRACAGAPALVVERVQVHRDGRLQVLPARPTVHLLPGDRDIQVTVRRLSTRVELPQYRARLEGQERDWIRLGRRGTRGFPQLPPGEHRLEFQARQGDAHWSVSTSVLLRVERGGWWHPAVVGLRAGGAGLLLGGGAWAAWRRTARLRERRGDAHRQSLAARSAEAKQRYLATLGHEIRTPLTGVLGMSELLLASPLSSAQRQQLERVRQGGQTLLHVLDQALDDARIEAGQMPLQAQGFDVARVLRQWQARTVLALCPRRTGLVVCVHLPGVPRVCGDPLRLQQMLGSVARVLSVRTASAGLVLQAWWRPGRQGLLFELATTGPRRSLREPVPTPAAPLLRAAMAQADAMVAALGGTLQLRAAGDHRWRVLISLPLPQLDVAPVVSPYVLLVTGDAAWAAACTALLEEQGYPVRHAAHALAALAELTTASAGLVLLEACLPGVDGPALLDLMRARGLRVPVQVISATARDPVTVAAVARRALPLAGSSGEGEPFTMH